MRPSTPRPAPWPGKASDDGRRPHLRVPHAIEALDALDAVEAGEVFEFIADWLTDAGPAVAATWPAASSRPPVLSRL
jgi:hypothetical protein